MEYSQHVTDSYSLLTELYRRIYTEGLNGVMEMKENVTEIAWGSQRHNSVEASVIWVPWSMLLHYPWAQWLTAPTSVHMASLAAHLCPRVAVSLLPRRQGRLGCKEQMGVTGSGQGE